MRHIAKRKRRNWTFKHIVLTIKKTENLKADVRTASTSLKKLWKVIGASDEMGMVCCLEIGPHLNTHIHCIYYGPFLPVEHLSRTWESLTGSKIVWISAVFGLAKAAKEVAKYISKNLIVDDDRLYQIYEALYGTRRVLEYGVFIGTASQETVRECPVCGSAELRFGRYIYDHLEAMRLRRYICEEYG